jgi:hypothetical protein
MRHIGAKDYLEEEIIFCFDLRSMTARNDLNSECKKLEDFYCIFLRLFNTGMTRIVRRTSQ